MDLSSTCTAATPRTNPPIWTRTTTKVPVPFVVVWSSLRRNARLATYQFGPKHRAYAGKEMPWRRLHRSKRSLRPPPKSSPDCEAHSPTTTCPAPLKHARTWDTSPTLRPSSPLISSTASSNPRCSKRRAGRGVTVLAQSNLTPLRQHRGCRCCGRGVI